MKQREKQKDDRKRETIGGSNDKKKGEQMIVHDYKHGIIGEGKKRKKKNMITVTPKPTKNKRPQSRNIDKKNLTARNLQREVEMLSRKLKQRELKG